LKLQSVNPYSVVKYADLFILLVHIIYSAIPEFKCCIHIAVGLKLFLLVISLLLFWWAVFLDPVNLTTSYVRDVCFTCEPPESSFAKYAPSFILNFTSDVFMHMYTNLLFKLLGQTRGCQRFSALVDKEYLIIRSQYFMNLLK
jgi:hypothetical protein